MALTSYLARVLGQVATSANLRFSQAHPTTGCRTFFSDSLITGSGLPDGFLSLTYDDGPGPQTLEIGRYLADQGICATFFICGAHVLGNEGTLDKLVAWGHQIGNHSFSHRPLCSAEGIIQPWRLSWRVADILRADKIVRPYANGPWIPFRPPHGYWSSQVARVMNRASGLRDYFGPVGWNIGQPNKAHPNYRADWECWMMGIGHEECAAGYWQEITDKKKGIVIMHDGPTPASKTWELTRTLIPRLREQGFRFVSLDSVHEIASRVG